MKPPIRYLTVQEVSFIHAMQIERYGGLPQVLNPGSLGSAVFRPQQVVFGEEVYGNLTVKAAALLESLARNHAFVDGNKRVAYAATLQFLRLNDRRLTAIPDDAEAFVIEVAAGKLDVTQIATWIAAHLVEA